MEIEKITELLEAGMLAGIALDTSEFEAQGMRLETGLLAQMTQFSEGNTRFLIPDVVLREVTSHLIARTSEARNNVLRALGKVTSLWGLTEDVRANVEKTLFGEKEPETQVDERLQRYAHNTSAKVLPADDYVDFKTLTGMYFESKPPFEETGAKKSEFPDAIALLCLEAWALKNDVYVLVVSRDSGWVEFCEQTERLIPVGDLAHALTYFQLRTNAQAVCKAFSQLYERGLPSEIASEIQTKLDHEIWEVQFSIEASSNYPYEQDVCDVSVSSYKLNAIGEDNEVVVPIWYTSNKLVVAAEMLAMLLVEIDFSFSYRDPIDKDYVPLGSETVSTRTEVTIDCLMTFEGAFESDPSKFRLTALEVQPTVAYLELGEVEPDWME